MAVKKFRPTTPSRRQMTMATFDEITTNSPEKSLLVSLKKTGGRNAQGKITVRHHGGGAKRKYRIIDFKRNKDGIPAKVATIEYDPNRTAYICLLYTSISPLIELAEKENIKIVEVSTMKELGLMSGIEVRSAATLIIEK